LQRLDRSNVETTEAQKSLPHLIAGLESLLDQKNGVSQSMFDALHEELKDYKDGFLLESILKPIIRDLVSLYDDLATISPADGGMCRRGVMTPGAPSWTGCDGWKPTWRTIANSWSKSWRASRFR